MGLAERPTGCKGLGQRNNAGVMAPDAAGQRAI